MKILWELYASFFRIGLFTFGGGYAMLPMLEREIVEKHGWASREDLLDYFAIGQATPGIIAVNTATLVGYRKGKAAGALAGTLGIITPSLIIICIVAAILQSVITLPVVEHAFAGVRVAVCALIVSAVIKLFKSNVLVKPPEGQRGLAAFLRTSGIPLLLCVAAFVLVALFDLSPIPVVVGAAVAGLVLYGRKGAGT